MFDNSEINWQDYESITKYIYESLGMKYGVKVVGYGRENMITGKSGLKHQVDVLTEQFNGDQRLLTAIECKYCKSKVNKDVVMKLSKIMEDSGIARGIIVCKAGFTKNTVTYAEHEGINLVVLKEADDKDENFKKEVVIGNLIIKSNIVRSRPNITSINFGRRTIYFDPATGAVYYLKMTDAHGNEIPLKPYLFEFGEKLISQGKVLKNTTIDLPVSNNLFLKLEKEEIAVEKLSITGFLTIDDLSTVRSIRLTDQVWLIMEELFDKRRLTLSKTGLIWNLNSGHK